MLDATTTKKFASATPKMLADAARHFDTAAFLGQRMRKTDTREQSSAGDEKSLFSKIAALKAMSVTSSTPKDLRRLAADGHARAKSVAVAKEDILGSSVAATLPSVGPTTLADVMTVPPALVSRPPPLEKKTHKQNLLSHVVPLPEIKVISSSPQGDDANNRSSDLEQLRYSPRLIKPSVSRLSPANGGSGTVDKAAPRSVDASLSPKGIAPGVSNAFVVERIVDNQAWREELDALKGSITQMSGLLKSHGSRIRQLEVVSIVLALLLILSLALR
jgi:hypothetical protein